jgi:hypothetical protein
MVQFSGNSVAPWMIFRMSISTVVAKATTNIAVTGILKALFFYVIPLNQNWYLDSSIISL